MPPRSQSRNYVESRVRGIKTILNKLMSLYNESIRKEVLELFLEQVCDIVNCTPYKTDAESIHLSPSCFLGFKKAPDLLWTREVKDSGKIGRALNSVLLKLKNWHLCNIKQRSDQIQSSTAKFLIVKQSTKKSSRVPPFWFWFWFIADAHRLFAARPTEPS